MAENNKVFISNLMYGRYAPKNIMPAAAADRLALEKKVLTTFLVNKK